MTETRAFRCPACGGEIAIKAAGTSVAVACQHCGSELDVSQPEVQLVTRYTEAAGQLLLPLGSRGTLQGVEWDVIGFLERGDAEGESWNEYLLFNPYAGYRWLVESGRDWQLGTPLNARPEVLSESDVAWQGARFIRDYEPATTETRKVVGEFYWRVERGSEVEATTYTGFDSSLGCEWTADEQSWTQLVPVKRQDVLAAFGVIPPAGDAPAGVGRESDLKARPFSGPHDLPKMYGLAIATIIACVLALWLIGTGNGPKTPPVTLMLDIGGAAQSVSLGRVVVDRPYRFITIEAEATSFQNKWVDLDYTLINQKTQRAITGSDTLQYYTGRDSDGNWSEGSHWQTSRFGGVPRGVYEVVVEASAHDWRPGGYFEPPAAEPPIIVEFTAFKSGPGGGELYMAAMAVLFLPIIMLLIIFQRSDEEEE